MKKSLFAALLLLVAMVCVAVHVSRTEQSDTTSHGAVYTRPGNASQVPPQRFGHAINESNSPKVDTSGSGGSLEDNPFVAAGGLVLILCAAFGFYKYHKILEEREDAAEAAKASECSSGRCGYSPERSQKS